MAESRIAVWRREGGAGRHRRGARIAGDVARDGDAARVVEDEQEEEFASSKYCDVVRQCRAVLDMLWRTAAMWSMTPSERIACALGWSVEDFRAYSNRVQTDKTPASTTVARASVRCKAGDGRAESGKTVERWTFYWRMGKIVALVRYAAAAAAATPKQGAPQRADNSAAVVDEAATDGAQEQDAGTFTRELCFYNTVKTRGKTQILFYRSLEEFGFIERLRIVLAPEHGGATDWGAHGHTHHKHIPALIRNRDAMFVCGDMSRNRVRFRFDPEYNDTSSDDEEEQDEDEQNRDDDDGDGDAGIWSAHAVFALRTWPSQTGGSHRTPSTPSTPIAGACDAALASGGSCNPRAADAVNARARPTSKGNPHHTAVMDCGADAERGESGKGLQTGPADGTSQGAAPATLRAAVRDFYLSGDMRRFCAAKRQRARAITLHLTDACLASLREDDQELARFIYDGMHGWFGALEECPLFEGDTWASSTAPDCTRPTYPLAPTREREAVARVVRLAQDIKTFMGMSISAIDW